MIGGIGAAAYTKDEPRTGGHRWSGSNRTAERPIKAGAWSRMGAGSQAGKPARSMTGPSVNHPRRYQPE